MCLQLALCKAQKEVRSEDISLQSDLRLLFAFLRSKLFWGLLPLFWLGPQVSPDVSNSLCSVAEWVATCVYTYIYIRTYRHAWTRMHVCPRMHAHIQTCTKTHTITCTHTHTCTHIHMHIHIFIHTHIHMQAHTHTLEHMQA